MDDHPDYVVVKRMYFNVNPASGAGAHATHVAGLVAGTYTGVAPGTEVISYAVLGPEGYGTIEGIELCLDYLTTNPDTVAAVNASLGWTGWIESVEIASKLMQRSGIVFIVANGNNASDTWLNMGDYKTQFATMFSALPNVLSVTAMQDNDGQAGGIGGENDDQFASFTSYNLKKVNNVIAAPGVNIWSTYLNGVYAAMSGTSMASPIVTGHAMLYMEQHGRATDSAGVQTVYQSLISNGQAQEEWLPGGLTRDPDPNHEPLVYYNGNPPPPVNNHPPVIAKFAPDTSYLALNESKTYPLVYSDEDNDPITVTYGFSPQGIVEVSLNPSKTAITVKGIGNGWAWVGVRVRDSLGATNSVISWFRSDNKPLSEYLNWGGPPGIVDSPGVYMFRTQWYDSLSDPAGRQPEIWNFYSLNTNCMEVWANNLSPTGCDVYYRFKNWNCMAQYAFTIGFQKHFFFALSEGVQVKPRPNTAPTLTWTPNLDLSMAEGESRTFRYDITDAEGDLVHFVGNSHPENQGDVGFRVDSASQQLTVTAIRAGFVWVTYNVHDDFNGWTLGNWIGNITVGTPPTDFYPSSWYVDVPTGIVPPPPPPPLTYNCVDYSCVEILDGTGSYTSLADCQAVCKPPPPPPPPPADTTGPRIFNIQPSDYLVGTKGNLELSFEASDPSGVATMGIWLNDELLGSCTLVNFCKKNVNLNKLKSGEHTVKFVAVDKLSNVTRYIFKVRK